MSLTAKSQREGFLFVGPGNDLDAIIQHRTFGDDVLIVRDPRVEGAVIATDNPVEVLR